MCIDVFVIDTGLEQVLASSRPRNKSKYSCGNKPVTLVTPESIVVSLITGSLADQQASTIYKCLAEFVAEWLRPPPLRQHQLLLLLLHG